MTGEYRVDLCELSAGWPGTDVLGMRLDQRVSFTSLAWSKQLSDFGEASLQLGDFPYLPRPYETGICVSQMVAGSQFPQPRFLGIVQDVALQGLTSGAVGVIELAAWTGLTATPKDLRYDQWLEIDLLKDVLASVGRRNPGVVIGRYQNKPITGEYKRDRSYDAGQNVGDAIRNMSRVLQGQQFRTQDSIGWFENLGIELAQTELSYGYPTDVRPQLVTDRIADFAVSISAAGSRNRAVSTVTEGEGASEVSTILNRTSYRDAKAIDFAASYSAGTDLSIDAVIDDLDGTLTRGRLGQVMLSITSRHPDLLGTLPGEYLDVRAQHPYPVEARVLVTAVTTTVTRETVIVELAVDLPEGYEL